jgi:hypothetical protein
MASISTVGPGRQAGRQDQKAGPRTYPLLDAGRQKEEASEASQRALDAHWE